MYYGEDYRPSYMFYKGTDGKQSQFNFDTLIVVFQKCTSVFVAYGDGAHCQEQLQKNEAYDKNFKRTEIAYHNAQLEELIDKAEEVIAILNGEISYHKFKE